VAGFGRKSLRFELPARANGEPDRVDTGAKLEGGENVTLTGGAFSVASPRRRRSQAPVCPAAPCRCNCKAAPCTACSRP
jgi:hypothetical protein